MILAFFIHMANMNNNSVSNVFGVVFVFDVMDMVQHGTTRMNNFLKYETIFKE